MSKLYDIPINDSSSQTLRTFSIDIGTTKCCSVVASLEPYSSSLKILGIGIAESEGLNRGVVVNIDKTTRAIKNVVEQAEQQSGVKITDVNISISGDHIESVQSRGIITISNPTTEITQKDVDRLLDEARKINIPSDRQILHVIPQDFIIDGQDSIQDPVGMSGLRLEANVHIITGLKSAIQNLTRCVERAGLRIKNLVLQPIASANSVLSDEEKEVGVALVDIGGGTTDIVVYADKIIRYTSIFGIAGNQITSDLQQGLGITLANAEKVKRENGHTHLDSIAHDEPIMIPGITGRKPQEISKNLLCQILQPRMAEIFEIVKAELKNSGYYNRLGAGGIVLTGGSTLMKGIEQLAQDILEMPVKIGMPTGLTYAGLAPEIESPVYATAVGLALWGINDTNTVNSDPVEEKTSFRPEPEPKDKPYKLPEIQKQNVNVGYRTEDKQENTKKPGSDWLTKIKDKLKEL